MKYALYAISLSLDGKYIQKLSLGKRYQSVAPYYSGVAVYYTDDFPDPILMLKENMITPLMNKITSLNNTIEKISKAKIK